jgi:hypothetical protein
MRENKMKNTWKLNDFTKVEIKEYVIERNLDSALYLPKQMLDLLDESYDSLVKDNLWYEVDTDMTYKGASWVSKPSQSPDDEDLLDSREEVLKWIFGHEVYCEIVRKINLERMENENGNK